jgi:RNA 2',3'-cyclic 3'-phosphodiesterase
MKRLFFALWPDHQTRQSLLRLSHLMLAQTMKAVRPRNYHVTLVFLGNVDESTELLITQRVEAIAAQGFELSFDQLSYWRQPKVLCLTSRHAVGEAAALVAALEKQVSECGLHIETQPYIPHVTLARHARSAPEISFAPIVWRAESFCLVESCSQSSGVVYKVLRQWSLCPGRESIRQ